MNLPRVDVVIASNRGGPFLDEAIDTALDQEGVSVRLILVDDGSPNPEFMERAARRREGVAVVRQPAQGVSEARNTGLQHVEADLVAFLDDDDVWHPRRLLTLSEVLTADPEAVGAYSGGWFLDDAGEACGVPWGAARASREELLRGIVPLPIFGSVLFRSQTCRAVGGFTATYRYAEDDDFTLRVLQRGALRGVDEPLFGYRRHANNVSNADRRITAAASDQMLRASRADALARGDLTAADWLDENRRRLRGGVARGFGHEIPARLRVRDFSRARELSKYGLRTDPRNLVLGVAQKLVSFARSNVGAKR